MDQKSDTAPRPSAPVAPKPAPGRWQQIKTKLGFRLTPVNRRRWERFKSHKLGFRSFQLFFGLFFLSLFAEFIANDRPLIAMYKGEILFPVLVDYPEEKFGGFLAYTDFRTADIANEINANGWMLWPLIRYSYDTVNKDYPGRAGANNVCLGYPAPPPWATSTKLCDATPDRLERFNKLGNTNWLGLDNQGRDVLARVIYGYRVSVLFGLLLTIVSSAVGVFAGAVQGYFGGRTDLIFQRILEIWNSIPELFVLLILSSMFVPGFWTLLGILLIFSWTSLVGLVRAEFLRGRNLEYVRAARALGLSDWQIMFKHLLPNAMVATLTFLPFKLSSGISLLTALDFLGLGMPPGSPSLGELLLQGKKHPEAPWLGISGFISVSIILSLAVFMGEALRDALDPRKSFKGK
jgi:microcin C transport system permease protein